jgi:hypothetical protein
MSSLQSSVSAVKRVMAPLQDMSFEKWISHHLLTISRAKYLVMSSVLAQSEEERVDLTQS